MRYRLFLAMQEHKDVHSLIAYMEQRKTLYGNVYEHVHVWVFFLNINKSPLLNAIHLLLLQFMILLNFMSRYKTFVFFGGNRLMLTAQVALWRPY